MINPAAYHNNIHEVVVVCILLSVELKWSQAERAADKESAADKFRVPCMILS